MDNNSPEPLVDNDDKEPLKSHPKNSGIPGESLILFHRHPGITPSDPMYHAPLTGMPGNYTVTFVLGRPELNAFKGRAIQLAQGELGDSHLKLFSSVPPPGIDEMELWIELPAEWGSLTLRAYANKTGHLARIETLPFHAQDRLDAERRATRVVQGLLSEESARLDIPFQIELIEVMEHKTFTKSAKVTALFPDNESFQDLHTIDPEFGVSAALYREGLQASSSVYRFLCFYKILEISRIRRSLPSKKRKVIDRLYRPGEFIPFLASEVENWLNAIYPARDWSKFVGQMVPQEARGKKINALVDKVFEPLRNRIAHGILKSGQVLHIDDPATIEEIAYWLPLLRCAVRRILKNDFPAQYLNHLPEGDAHAKNAEEAPNSLATIKSRIVGLVKGSPETQMGHFIDLGDSFPPVVPKSAEEE